MTARLRLLGCALMSVIGLMAGLIASSTPALAADKPTADLATHSYVYHVTQFRAGANGIAQGTFECPEGSKVATGGASSPYNLTNSWPTLDQTGWYASGIVGAYKWLTVEIQCVPAYQLAASTAKVASVRRDDGVPYLTAVPTCTFGTTVYTGGGYFSFGDTDEGLIYASFPWGNGWFFGGKANPLSALTASARCLPENSVPQTLTVSQTVISPPNGMTSATVRCPAGQRALTGGAYWHDRTSEYPSPIGYLSYNSVLSDASGWHAGGLATISGAARLTVTVRCSSI